MENIGEQWERRGGMPAQPIVRREARTAGARSHPDMDPALVIDILVAALRGHDTEPEARSFLHGTGSPATAPQVATVFRHYGIGKKNSPAGK